MNILINAGIAITYLLFAVMIVSILLMVAPQFLYNKLGLEDRSEKIRDNLFQITAYSSFSALVLGLCLAMVYFGVL